MSKTIGMVFIQGQKDNKIIRPRYEWTGVVEIDDDEDLLSAFSKLEEIRPGGSAPSLSMNEIPHWTSLEMESYKQKLIDDGWIPVPHLSGKVIYPDELEQTDLMFLRYGFIKEYREQG